LAARRRILILNGHADHRPERLCSGLCDAYTTAAAGAGHQVRRLDVAALDFPLIRTAQDFIDGPPPPDIAAAQATMGWAEHLVIVHPLWLGGPPALLNGFFEQVFRYDFALPAEPEGRPKGLLAGRSARLIVTAGRRGSAGRWLFGGRGADALERGLLAPLGFKPIGRTFITGVDEVGAPMAAWFARIRDLGRAGA
jgi:putative NADPH-quinone reductase